MEVRRFFWALFFILEVVTLSWAASETSSQPPSASSLSCPEISEGSVGTCVQECSSDANCTGSLKCCSNGCGMTCVDGVIPSESEEVDVPPRLVWTEVFTTERQSRINSLPANPQEYISNTTIATRYKYQVANRNFLAIATDFEAKLIFFSDGVSKQIFKGSLDDDEGASVIYKGTSQNVEGIALDWVAKNLYWCDASYDWIIVANYLGENARILVDTGLDKPRDIVVFPQEGYMYWTDWGNTTTISKATLSGDGVTPLVESDLVFPNGLAIDYASRTLYWVDANPSGSRVESFSLDGSNRRRLFSTPAGQAHFFDVTPFQEYLFMTDWHGKLQCINRTSGAFYFNLNLRSRPHGITTYGSGLLPAYPASPCLSNPCDHLCLHDASQEYKCVCGQGYVHNENQTCVRDEGLLIKPQILLLSKTKLCYFPVHFADLVFEDEFEPPCILTERTHSVALAVDVHANWAFFSDFQWKRIYRVRLTSNSQVEQISGGVGSVEGMAVDYINQKLYWTDHRLNHIVVSNYDGSYRITLVDEDVIKPRSIVIHMESRTMFWTEFGPPYQIERADLDGGNRRVIVTLRSNPSGLALDDVTGRLVFGETGSGTIYSYDLVTDTMVSIHTRSRTIPFYDMEIIGDYLIWTEWGSSNGIHALNLETASIHQSQLISEPVYGVRLFGNSKQRANATIDDCGENNGECSQLCVATATGHRCYCSTGFKLGTDGRSCETGALVSNNFALVTDSYEKTIFQVDLSSDSHNFTAIALEGLKNPIAVDYDPVDSKIYFTDVIAKRVVRANLDGTEMEDLAVDYVVVPDGLAIDYVSRLLFWSDTGEDVISVSHLDGTHRRSLIKDNLDQPRAMALEPFDGLIFWSDWGEQPKIERAYMDGTHRAVIVANDIAWVNGLTIDRTNSRLYWCDAKTDMIEASGYDGSDRFVFADLGATAHPFGIGVFGEYIYWTDWLQASLLRANKSQPENDLSPIPIGSGSFLRLNGIAIYSAESALEGETQCSINNGGCGQLCLMTPSGRQCHCEDGSGLLEDLLNCQERDSLCPSAVSNGQFPYHCDRMPGAQCSVECDEGYYAAHKNFTCLEGPEWNFPEEYICQAITCPAINATVNAEVSGCFPPHILGTVCRFNCKHGFSYSSGSNDRTCQEDGTWSGEDLFCDITVCPVLPQPKGGLFQPERCTEGSVEFEGQCRVFCSQGYQPNGETLLTCLATGDWNVEPLRVECLDTSPPEFTEECLTVNVTLMGTNLYHYVGNNYGATDNSGEVEVTYNLPPPVYLEEGVHLFVQTARDKANNQAVCSYTVNVIVNHCAMLSIPFNSDMNGVCDTHHGATCEFRCNPGFRLVGNSVLTCGNTTDGQFIWDDVAPHCEAILCPEPEIGLGVVREGCAPPYYPEFSCFYLCKRGYENTGGNILQTCQQSGEWTGTPLNCTQLTCPALTAPKNGGINPPECTATGAAAGDACTYSCSEGFQLEGPPQQACSLAGEWMSADAPRTCKDVNGPQFNGTCPHDMVLVASTGEITAVANWESPTVHDREGHVLNISSTPEAGTALGEGMHFVVIQAFDDSGNRGSCFFTIEVKVIRCPLHPIPGNAKVQNQTCDDLVNSECTFLCNNGFRLVGSQTRTCQWDGSSEQGSWSGVEPVCEAITCPPFEVTDGLHVRGCNFDVDQVPFGSICTLFCEPGYMQVFEGIQMKCSENGTWQGENLECVPVVCEALALKRNSSVLPESCINGTRALGVCSYSCDSGFAIVGPENRTCSANGVWNYDDQAPTCKDVEPPTFIDCPEDPIIQRSEAVCLSRVILDVSEPSAQDNSGYVTVTKSLQNPFPSGNYSLEFIARDPAGLIAVCQIPVQVIVTSCPEVLHRTVESLSCGSLLGSVATFRCSPHERQIGARNATCQADGTWSAPPPTCEAVFCPPLVVTGGIVIANQCPHESAVPGTQCEVLCTLNNLSPRRIVTCSNEDATWRLPDGTSYDPDFWTPHCTDQTPPVITCPPDVIYNLPNDSNVMTVTWSLPTATDNLDTSVDISGPTVPVDLTVGRYIQSYVATDKNGNTDRCTFAVKIADVTPPMVSDCPTGVVVVQIQDIQDTLNWTEPVFTDTDRENIRVTVNLLPGLPAYSFGMKHIQYEAVDGSSNVAKCEFHIDVIPVRDGCKQLDKPLYGGLTCTHQKTICTVTCNAGYALPRNHDAIFTCNNGVWNNRANIMTPNCAEVTRRMSRMDVMQFSLASSTCSGNEDAMKVKFMEILQDSIFMEYCNQDSGMFCKMDSLQVECGEETRKKRAADVTGNQANITFVIHAFSNSTLDTFESALNLSVSAFFGPSNPIIELANGFRAELVPEQSMQGMPLVNCTAGEEPFELTCLSCPPGTFFRMRLQRCIPCPIGHYQDMMGQTSCKMCVDGSSTAATGTPHSRYCRHQCQPGEYSHTGLQHCLLCPENMYQPSPGSLGCLPCPEGTFSDRKGSSYASSCRGLEPDIPMTTGIDTTTLSTTTATTTATTVASSKEITNSVVDMTTTTTKQIPTKKQQPPDEKDKTEKPTKKTEEKEGKGPGKKAAATGGDGKGKKVWMWLVIGVAALLGFLCLLLLVAYISRKRQWAGHRRLYHSEQPFGGNEFENDHNMYETPHKSLEPEVSGSVVAFQNPAFAEVDL
ncbi:uncharacterized protein [Apostichopus japonicus]|uniref:uncharacterized protein isoform X2 n=1 Tax=Stichopus japonicus TaxID=307972 RepID=UPI003AB6D0CA